MKNLLAVSILFFLYSSTIQAQPQTFSSGDKQVNLIELYTSEGCSSCPPADEWLGRFKYDPRLWKQIIPLAFHVDYWDYIGWKDRFAEVRYGDRQRYYAFSNQLSGVYTPGVMLNGRELRAWYHDRPLELSGEPEGELSVSLDNKQLDIYFDSKDKSSMLNINIAILGFGVKTDIKQGENHGRVLTHDFVVLGYKMVRMQRNGDRFEVFTSLPSVKIQSEKLAVVAWINKPKDLTPIQATGGWIIEK